MTSFRNERPIKMSEATSIAAKRPIKVSSASSFGVKHPIERVSAPVFALERPIEGVSALIFAGERLIEGCGPDLRGRASDPRGAGVLGESLTPNARPSGSRAGWRERDGTCGSGFA